jgi:hypothetical protein
LLLLLLLSLFSCLVLLRPVPLCKTDMVLVWLLPHRLNHLLLQTCRGKGRFSDLDVLISQKVYSPVAFKRCVGTILSIVEFPFFIKHLPAPNP